MNLRIATLFFLSVMIAIPATFSQTISRELMIFYTQEWEGERFPDGRPKVPDNILERAKNISIEEAWGVLRNKGYHNQFDGGWEMIHDDEPVVGRALTAFYMPKRPELEKRMLDKGHAEGRVGSSNSWPIDMLSQGDVYVADCFGKVIDGTLIGDNLGNSIFAKSGNGVVFDGGSRDLAGLEKRIFQAFARDALAAWRRLTNHRPCTDLKVQLDGVKGLRSSYCSIRTSVNLRRLEMMAGVPFFRSSPHRGESITIDSKRSFGHYNPQMIDWVARNLIPTEDDRSYLRITRPIYDRYLAQLAQAYHRTYVQWSRHARYFRAERQILIDIINGRRQWEFMGGRWQSSELISKLDLDVDRENLDWYHVNTALRYWQRRSIDSTASQVFAALEKLLRVYDPDFLASAPLPDPTFRKLEMN